MNAGGGVRLRAIVRFAGRVFGVALVALGGLWALQGAGVVHLAPVACVAHCDELTGPSLAWVGIGLATVVAGVWLVRGRR
jgi:drug/metabolite transporter (DMT)-like permease